MSNIYTPDENGRVYGPHLPSTEPTVDGVATNCSDLLSIDGPTLEVGETKSLGLNPVGEKATIVEGSVYRNNPSEVFEDTDSHYLDFKKLLEEEKTDEILYVQIPKELEKIHEALLSKSDISTLSLDLEKIYSSGIKKEEGYIQGLSEIISGLIARSENKEYEKITHELIRLSIITQTASIHDLQEISDFNISKEIRYGFSLVGHSNKKGLGHILNVLLRKAYYLKPKKIKSKEDIQGLYLWKIADLLAPEVMIKITRSLTSVIGPLLVGVMLILISPYFYYISRKRNKSLSKEKKKYKEVLDIFLRVISPLMQDYQDENYLYSEDINSVELSLKTQKFNFPFPKSSNFREVLDGSKPNIFILGTSEDSLALAREVDNQNTANAIMIVSLSNLIPRKLGKKAYTKKGIVYKNGQIYNVHSGSDTIEGHYVFSGTSNDEDSLVFNKKNVPQAGMRHMDFYTQNKEICSYLLEKSGINTPPKAHFVAKKDWLEDSMQYRYASRNLTSYKNNEEGYAKMINYFTKRNIKNVVIKPTGGSGGRDVHFIDLHTEQNKAKKVIIELIDNGENVIVEERIPSVPIEIEGEKMDWNLRVFVSRNEDDPVVSDIEIRMDKDGKPVNISISAKVLRFDKLKELINISPMEFDVLKQRIEEISVGAFSALEGHIRESEYVEDHDKQDFMGIDIIVKKVPGGFAPFIIEVNDQASGGMWDLDNIESGENIGRSSRDLAILMSKRAKAYMDR